MTKQRRSGLYSFVTIAAWFLAVSLACQPAVQSKTIPVAAGGDLQAAANMAQPGDTITLEPGKIYKCNLELEEKPAGGYITITTLGVPAGRVTPAAAARFAKIVTSIDEPVIATRARAHHWRLVGLEIYACKTPDVYPCPADQGLANLGTLIDLGPSSITKTEDQASDLELDRLYVHGHPVSGGKRGIALNSRNTVIKNSYISDFKLLTLESQAILGWNGTKDVVIENNYLEAAAQNMMFGGTAPTMAIPSGIKILHNHFAKPLAWRRLFGAPKTANNQWVIKNLFELKYARKVEIRGNIFEYTWVQAVKDEQKFAIALTVRAHNGRVPDAVVEDVVFAQNIVRHAQGGINILAGDYNSPYPTNPPGCQTTFDPANCKYYGKASNITIENNLFDDIDAEKWAGYVNGTRWTPGAGSMFMAFWAPNNVVINHNTLFQTSDRGTKPGGQALMWFGRSVKSAPVKCTGFKFTNNIAYYGKLGLRSEGFPTDAGSEVLNRWTVGGVFHKNVVVGGLTFAPRFPPQNFFVATDAEIKFIDKPKGDYRLAPDSPFKNAGSDGADIGANIEALNTAVSGAKAGR